MASSWVWRGSYASCLQTRRFWALGARGESSRLVAFCGVVSPIVNGQIEVPPPHGVVSSQLADSSSTTTAPTMRMRSNAMGSSGWAMAVLRRAAAAQLTDTGSSARPRRRLAQAGECSGEASAGAELSSTTSRLWDGSASVIVRGRPRPRAGRTPRRRQHVARRLGMPSSSKLIGVPSRGADQHESTASPAFLPNASKRELAGPDRRWRRRSRSCIACLRLLWSGDEGVHVG